jgi:recombinational DNA repair ATPase RecF
MVNIQKNVLRRPAKSLLFALKLAGMVKRKKVHPLLLLDDVLKNWMKIALQTSSPCCIENNGQVFITDTNQESFLTFKRVINKLPANSPELSVAVRI